MITSTRALVEWIAHHSPSLAIERAIYDSNVEILGWFESIPGSIYPGWIVRITSSLTNLSWNVVVRRIPFNRTKQYRAWITAKIDWSSWNTCNSQNPLIRGDRYEIYKRLRHDAKVGDGSEISSTAIRCEQEHKHNTQLGVEGLDES